MYRQTIMRCVWIAAVPDERFRAARQDFLRENASTDLGDRPERRVRQSKSVIVSTGNMGVAGGNSHDCKNLPGRAYSALCSLSVYELCRSSVTAGHVAYKELYYCLNVTVTLYGLANKGLSPPRGRFARLSGASGRGVSSSVPVRRHPRVHGSGRACGRSVPERSPRGMVMMRAGDG